MPKFMLFCVGVFVIMTVEMGIIRVRAFELSAKLTASLMYFS